MSQPPAILYAAHAYDPAQRMMGRQVASEAFLHAVARHEPAAELTVCAATRDDVSAFHRAIENVALYAPDGASRRYHRVQHGDVAGLAEAGCLHGPDPALHDDAWLRCFVDPRSYSLRCS